MTNTELKAGQLVKVPNDLTTDPANRQGQLGKVVTCIDGVAAVEFQDGKSSQYIADALEVIELEEEKAYSMDELKNGAMYLLNGLGDYDFFENDKHIVLGRLYIKQLNKNGKPRLYPQNVRAAHEIEHGFFFLNGLKAQEVKNA